MRKWIAATVLLALLLCVTGCAPEAPEVELTVFAAASMTETLNQVAALYEKKAPHVKLRYNFDSSGTLKTQIQEGADCDVFISAAQKQMNQLDAAGGNTEGLDFVLGDTRINLVENKVVLVVPAGNPAGVTDFADVTADKINLIALGNADVPVGQYAQDIFTDLGVWDSLNAQQKITFAANVKEVAAQVNEGAVDCGVVYGTDAFSNRLTQVAEAPPDSHAPVVYPAAVLNITRHEAEAKDFLAFLQTDACAEIFRSAGFSIPD